MSALGASCSCLVGPVPFKDVLGAAAAAAAASDDDGDHRVSPADEYAHIISTLPSVTFLGDLMYNYRGAWVSQRKVPGAISLQRRFAPRPAGDDVLLASAPKCGTTWLKALSFAIMARAAHPPSGADDHPLIRLNPHEVVPSMDDFFSAGQEAKLDALPSPRLMNTHTHHSSLPAAVAAGRCRIVYVCREPKDMLVSLWHFVHPILPAGSTYTFSDMFEPACEGKTPFGPVWDHILGYWLASKARPEKVLFLRYEEMLIDPVVGVRELARFLGTPFSAAEEAAGMPADIVKLCSIETMRGLGANKTGAAGLFYKFPHESFFRKGEAGDWVNHMTPEMARRFDAIVEDKLRGSGLAFESCL